MKLRKAATILVVLVCAAIQVSSALAQGGQTDGPLTKNKLMKMLLLNDSSQQDLIQLVKSRGVDFRPTPTEEREIGEAGGSDDLIVAVRANVRGATQDNAQANQSPSGPAAANDLATPKSSQTANETAAPQKKKGFLDKLNSGMDKTNAKLTKINSEVNKQTQAVQATATQAAQTAQTLKTQATQTAQSLKTRGQAMTSKSHSNAKTSDGALYGDYQIKRNGNEMILDDGTWRLRLRYYSPVKC